MYNIVTNPLNISQHRIEEPNHHMYRYNMLAPERCMICGDGAGSAKHIRVGDSNR